MKKNELNQIVEDVLKEHPEARDDDHKLFIWVCYYQKPELLNETFSKAFWNHNENGLPSFETITRIRRKAQEKKPELRGKAYDKRHQKESEYIMQYGRRYS